MPAPLALNQSTRPPTHTVRLRGLNPETLACLLEQVIEHVDTDDTLPLLTCVHIRLGRGRMHAMATDRYTGAIASMPVRTEETARITIPATFARRMLEALRPDECCDSERPAEADLTISPNLFGLTVHEHEPISCWCDGDYTDNTTRLAVRFDPHADTINLPAVAIRALSEPASTDPLPVNVRLLSRFFTYGPIIPLDTATGRLQPDATDLLTRYAVHNTGSLIVLTRPDFLGILTGCRTAPKTDPAPHTAIPAETRTAWRHQLAQIA